MSRTATHAGTWYERSPARLRSQIDGWLKVAEPSHEPASRHAIGPHAGYRFCGHVLAHTYAALDRRVDRIVLMGPSHFKYFRGIQTTMFSIFETPLGSLEVDQDGVDRLRKSCGLQLLDRATDFKEHSWEMHLPFIATVAPHAKVLPLLFGAYDAAQTTRVIEELAQLSNEHTAIVVSSDFCHWGDSFDYMPFKSSGPLIYKQIDALDHEAIELLANGRSSGDWAAYIKRTGNTICGAMPIRAMLMLAELNHKPIKFTELAYDQSSKARSAHDSSVSYAALAG